MRQTDVTVPPAVDRTNPSFASEKPQQRRATIVYPMNALADNQLEENNRFLAQSELPPRLWPGARRGALIVPTLMHAGLVDS